MCSRPQIASEREIGRFEAEPRGCFNGGIVLRVFGKVVFWGIGGAGIVFTLYLLASAVLRTLAKTNYPFNVVG